MQVVRRDREHSLAARLCRVRCLSQSGHRPSKRLEVAFSGTRCSRHHGWIDLHPVQVVEPVGHAAVRIGIRRRDWDGAPCAVGSRYDPTAAIATLCSEDVFLKPWTPTRGGATRRLCVLAADQGDSVLRDQLQNLSYERTRLMLGLTSGEVERIDSALQTGTRCRLVAGIAKSAGVRDDCWVGCWVGCWVDSNAAARASAKSSSCR